MAVISAPKPATIPEWEQQLSAGAVCMTLLIAAQAMGYGANWITDWYAYDPDAAAVLGPQPHGERVAGFIYIGTPTEPPLERVRPDLATLTEWRRGLAAAAIGAARPGRAATGPRAAAPVCQKTSIGMPPRGYQ